MEDRPEDDRRNLDRMLCYLDVFDQTTGDLIGNANDIHHEGLNLISKEELPLLNNLSIWVEDLRDNVRIPLVIEGVWNQMEKNPVYFSTGNLSNYVNSQITRDALTLCSKPCGNEGKANIVEY